jgi:hypothetical protein
MNDVLGNELKVGHTVMMWRGTYVTTEFIEKINSKTVRLKDLGGNYYSTSFIRRDQICKDDLGYAKGDVVIGTLYGDLIFGTIDRMTKCKLVLKNVHSAFKSKRRKNTDGVMIEKSTFRKIENGKVNKLKIVKGM